MAFNYPDNHAILGDRTQDRGKGLSDLESNRIDATPQVSIHIEAPATPSRTAGTMTVTNTAAFPPTALSGTYAGYYSFDIPAGGVYVLYACGSMGGDITSGSYASHNAHGFGYQKCYEYTFSGGETIYMMAGQSGGMASDNTGAGGGGMSAIALSTGADPSSCTALLVGGGGGGDVRSGLHGNSFDIDWQSGNDGEKGHNGCAGASGLNIGASNAENTYQSVGNGCTMNNNTYYVNQGANRYHRFAGWHGGGFNTSGGGSSARSGGSAGDGFKQGCVGGQATGTAGFGGFGGGGSSSTNCGYGGGAGGYTGGMSGGYSNGCGGAGGGGGSYHEATMTVINAYTGRPTSKLPGCVGIIAKPLYLAGSGTYPNSDLPRGL